MDDLNDCESNNNMGDTVVRINNANDNNSNDENTNNGGHGEGEITYPGLRAMPYIIGSELFEKLASMGASRNFFVYLTTKFGMTTMAANQTLILSSTAGSLAVIVGAFLSDAFFGRFHCLAFGYIASLLGMVVLVLTAAIPSLQGHVGFFYLALAILTVSGGGLGSCSMPFGADQFRPNSRGLGRFFMWYFAAMGMAFIVSPTVLVYLQMINWTIGFAIAAFLMLLSVCIFFWGTNSYVRVRPQGSPFTSLARVIVAAFRKRRLQLPQDPSTLFDPVPTSSTVAKIDHTDQFRFLDKAAIVTSPADINQHGLAANPWSLCSIQQVEEVKCWIRVMPMWVETVMFNMFMAGQGQYMIPQAKQLNGHLGRIQIPPASFGVFSALSGSLLICFYDRVMVPMMRRRTGRANGFTLHQRLGAGIVIAALTMFVSGVVEKMRRDAALSSPADSSMSAFVLVPQLILAGFADACAITAITNFFYDRMPGNSKASVQAMLASAAAVANFVTAIILHILKHSWLVDDLNRGNLDRFYYMMGGFQVASFVYFVIICARWYA